MMNADTCTNRDRYGAFVERLRVKFKRVTSFDIRRDDEIEGGAFAIWSDQGVRHYVPPAFPFRDFHDRRHT